MEEIIVISKEEYAELIRQSERIGVLRRLYDRKSDSFVTLEEVKEILNIHGRTEGECKNG